MRLLVLEEPRPIKLTVEAFGLLGEAGAIDRDGRVELIEGVIVATSPQRRTHSYSKNEIAYRLRRAVEALGWRWQVQTEATLALPPHNAPVPDILLTDAPRGEGYVPAGSVSLVVEIADSSLRWDLEDKRRLYALHDIPEYWVVNVAGWQLHRFWRARGGDYAGHDVVPLTGELRRATLAGLAIVGADIV